MNTKSKKLFAIALTLCLLVMSSAAFAATRYAGQDRYQTAVSIVSGGWTTADTAVLATGESSADALCAAPLAKAYNAPIISVDPKGANTDALALLAKLGVKTVFIAGGTGAVPQAIEDAVKAKGMTVTRLAGADRYATSLAIANQLQTKLGAGATTIAVANGEDASFADALSVSSIAAFKGMPILLTSASALGFTVPSSVTKSYVIGGTGVVSDAVMAGLPGAVRVAGADRYATNLQVLATFPEFKYDKVFLATGENFPDALAGSALAAVTASPVVLVSPAMPAATQTFLAGKVTAASTVVALGGAAVVSDAAVAAVNGGAVVVPGGPVAVTSVKAVAADTMEVAFSAVPADTSKVVFTVNRETTPITVTATWNGSVASLKYSSKFPQGNYTVAVKNDATDLGTNNVTIDQEKIAKIELTTDKFAVSSEGKVGFFTYKVANQYGEDITNKNLASINWTVPGVTSGNISENADAKGVVQATVTDGTFNFLNLSSITITGVDTSANVVVTKTLSVSASVGTLSAVKLVEATNVDGKPLQAGNATRKWNITYEARDLAGNLTSNFVLLKGGLIDQVTPPVADEVTLSTSGYVHAKMINSSGTGIIELTVDSSADDLTTDVPVTVTAITKNGATSTLNLTLKKKSMPATFTLMAPVVDVAFGDAKEVPFACYNADGTQLTSFDDIVAGDPLAGTVNYTATASNSISLSPLYTVASDTGLYFTKRSDGTAKLNYKAPDVNGQTSDQSVTLTATTNTGKFSTVTINVRKPAGAASLAVNTDSIITRLAPNASIALDNSFFTAKDQYGRGMSLTGDYVTTGTLYVKAEVTNGDDYLQVDSPYANRSQEILMRAKSTATNGGTGTVRFSLIQNGTTLSTKSVDFSVIKLGDIKGIKMQSGADGATLYNTYLLDKGADTAAAVTNNVYRSKFIVYGVDANANTVILPEDQLNGTTVTVTKSSDYLTTATVLPLSSTTQMGVNLVAAEDNNKIQVKAEKSDEDNVTAVVTVSTVVGTSVRSTSFTVKLSETQAVATGITAGDQISVGDYATDAVLSDAISVYDQYGKDMLLRGDTSVTVYINGVKQADNYARSTGLTAIPDNTVLTIVDNAGHTASVTVKQ